MQVDDNDFQAAVAQAVADALAQRDAEARAAREKAEAEAAKAAQAAAEAEVERLAAEAEEARRWEGHTHTWGDSDEEGLCTCTECGLTLAVELLEGDA